MLALVLLTLYDSGRILVRQRAIETLQSRIYKDRLPARTVAFPHSVNPLQWDGWVETDRAWLGLNVDLTREFDPDAVSTFWKPDSIPMLDAAQRIPVFAEMLRFAKTPYWRVIPAEQPEGAQRVELIDLRFIETAGRDSPRARSSMPADGCCDQDFSFDPVKSLQQYVSNDLCDITRRLDDFRPDAALDGTGGSRLVR